MGYVRLGGSYLSPEDAAAQAQQQGAAWQQRIAGPYDPAAGAAGRAQYGPGMRRERALGMAPPAQGIEEIATGQATGALTRAQAMAGAEVAPQVAAAGVSGLEAGVGRVEAETGLIEAQGKVFAAIAQQALKGDVQTRASLQEGIAQARDAGDDEAAKVLTDLYMGTFDLERVPPSVLGRIYDILQSLPGIGWLLPERPGYRPREAPAGPAAPTGRAAAMGGSVGPQAGAGAGQPQVSDRDERELYERLRAKYGG